MLKTTLIEDCFRQGGQPLVFSGNQPLLLNDQDAAFLVVEGAVDVFAVPLSAGKAVGGRTHLCRVGAGHILLGLARQEFADSTGLLAVPGINTKALSLPRTRFMELFSVGELSGDANSLLSGWVDGLATGLFYRLAPKDAVELKPGSPVALKPEETTRTSGDILWTRHLEGSSYFMGHEDVILTAENNFIPHTCGLWLQAREPASLEVVISTDYARTEPGLPGLALFHELILDFVSRCLVRQAEEEEVRRRRQSQSERKSLQGALLDIASLMGVGEGDAASVLPAEDDALFSACRMVGTALNIDVKPSGQREGKSQEARLEAITRASRMRVRRVLLTGEWWREDHGPLLGFWREADRPVALLQQGETETLLRDPENRSSQVVDARIAGLLAPFACQFYRPLPDGPVSSGALLRFAAARTRKDFLTVLLVGALGALITLIIPIGTGIVFNTIIPEAARGQMIQLAVILLACAVGVALLEATKSLALLRIQTKTDAEIQAAIVDRLLALPASFFRNFTSGDLAERTLGLTAIRATVSLFTIQSGVAGLFAVFNLALMFWYSPKLAFVALVFVGTGGILMVLLNFMQVKRIRVMTAIEGRIAGMVLQFISGISKLRVAGAEEMAFSRWAREFSRQRRFAYRARNLGNLQTVLNTIFPALGLFVLFSWISQHPAATLRTGDFLAFLVAYTNLQAALFQVVAAFAAILGAVPLLERMQPILQAVPELDESKASPGELAGHLEVRSVTFRYSEDGPAILQDVSLEVKPGQFIALVGGSGSGKSTLLRLLLGFENPQSGGIYYDGKDISTLDCREIRRQIGVVLQSGSVTPGSILDSIRGANNLSEDDVWEAARLAGLEEDIKNMPMGLRTFISPGGETLSGGQRQRLLIAAALIRKPRVLYFDEATSALDNRTQETVSTSLSRLRATRVVIAHRLSTVINADCIHVLDKGRIVESGTYGELLKRDGAFAALVKRQII